MESFGFSSVATAQQGCGYVVEETDEIFCVRCLACTAHTQVADADGGDVGRGRLAEVEIIEKIAHRHPYGIPYR